MQDDKDQNQRQNNFNFSKNLPQNMNKQRAVLINTQGFEQSISQIPTAATAAMEGSEHRASA